MTPCARHDPTDSIPFFVVQPFWGLIAAFFIATTYISLDTAFGWTSAFGVSNPPIAQKNIALFVLTSIWPAVYVHPNIPGPARYRETNRLWLK